ncbi:IclR family transcriptional regulator [Microbacterium sp. 4R-513]|uniref:IclR family transcriptional regulator n=1 Tax=Microbacterium sp. 4R-513 TaxID=2567934 RepID=UPI0019D07582|nr:IclR family transcriptional regulator [Microbacterium sp. 4R-513]
MSAVFDAFGEEDEGLGVSELARRANLPKSTVSRIAADLVEQRFLDREGDRLYLGVRLFELGQTVQQPRLLRRVALPVMAELRDVTGQTVHLAVLDGGDVVFVAVVRGPASRPLVRIGSRLPAHATAVGKAMLAFAPQSVVTAVTGRELTRRTSKTITEASVLHREFADIRRLGVATEDEECTPGRACAASPILSSGVLTPLAAISVAGPAESLVPDRVAPAVRAAAMALSRRLSTDPAG